MKYFSSTDIFTSHIALKIFIFTDSSSKFTLVYSFLSAFYIFFASHNVSSLNRWCCWMHSQVFLAPARMGKNIPFQDIHNPRTKPSILNEMDIDPSLFLNQDPILWDFEPRLSLIKNPWLSRRNKILPDTDDGLG